MSDADREKWERRYAEGSYEARTHPTRLLVDWLPRIGKPEGARALDLACGAGRNALYLANEGYRVDAMDISGVALARGAARAAEMGVEVEWIETDLDHVALTPARYDLVVVARYVNRGLTEALVGALREGGHLLYDNTGGLDRRLYRPDVQEIGIPIAKLLLPEFQDPKQRQLVTPRFDRPCHPQIIAHTPLIVPLGPPCHIDRPPVLPRPHRPQILPSQLPRASTILVRESRARKESSPPRPEWVSAAAKGRLKLVKGPPRL